MNNQVTIIEITADFLCIVVLGDKKSIDDLIPNINIKNTPLIKYIAVKIDTPSANKCFEMNNNSHRNIIIDDGVESAQCYTYAEYCQKQLYMLMTIEDKNSSSVLGFPKIELYNDEDPELVVEDWFKKNIKNSISEEFKRNMRLTGIVGIDNNILVVATKINCCKKKKNRSAKIYPENCIT